MIGNCRWNSHGYNNHCRHCRCSRLSPDSHRVVLFHWNRLINLDENAQNAWNNIDVLLNQRYDMIPNMVNIVKGYAEHEPVSLTNSPRLAKPLLVR